MPFSEAALYQGSIRYLHSDWQQHHWTYTTLTKQSSFNPLQGKELIGNNRQSHPYGLFWSLCFGIRRQTFVNLGGFDSRFVGYGGEDTDFAFTARSRNLPFYYKISALAYHQFHSSYFPPLNHLEEIVINARVFYRKWNVLPMEKWLKEFEELGYIKLTNNRIKIIKYSTKSEIGKCLKIF